MSRTSILLIGSFGLLTIVWGCQTVQTTTGLKQEAFMQGDPERVVEAAKAALAELKLEQVTGSATKVDGQIQAKTAQGKDITITVKSAGENVSRLYVKVGAMGDKSISEAIIAETKKRL